LLLVANCGGPRFVLYFGEAEQKELHHGIGKKVQRVRADHCYLQIGSGKSLEAVIQQILSTEPKVTTINLNGFEG
jgi:hypothetical protein